MTLTLICSNCGTHFIEVKDVIEEPMYSHIRCPRCSLTLSLRLDAELLKTLSGATGVLSSWYYLLSSCLDDVMRRKR
jgi:DNA-directed RNA polymerase subunit RPC12/RpoP